ncbi:L,D-transpeptidase family protein [Sphingomonas sp.]|uniref:L,D-transpeptidase family protein n=1 Tax=Sphingomonas sp. TaxID=28214 RepID=UPI003CC52D78
MAGAAAAATAVAQAPARRAGPAATLTPAASPTATAAAIDRDILHVQVILDHLGFSPGMLDGKPGMSLTAALKGFQEARGVPITGKIDQPTLAALHPYAAWRPTVRLRLSQTALAGPFVGTIPHNEDEQARLPSLGYRNPLEKLAEMFHTTPAVLIALNSAQTRLAVGQEVVFPNALPTSRSYDDSLPPLWRQTLSDLNVDANQPQGKKIVVDKSDSVLRVLDANDRLVAQFQVTTGSEHDPLPIGTWKVTVIDRNPRFHYNPALFWDANSTDTAAMLPPGPNGPVGVVWLDLNKPHYGLHGTPEPQYIGRTESHGCVRLANWNAARLAQMVRAGVPVIFQE